MDVFTCAWCGGKRRVLAYLTAPNAVRAIPQHLALPTRPACAGCSPGATPAGVVLILKQSRCQLRSIPQGGVRPSLFGVRVTSERTLYLPHDNQLRLAILLELRRQPPLLGARGTALGGRLR